MQCAPRYRRNTEDQIESVYRRSKRQRASDSHLNIHYLILSKQLPIPTFLDVATKTQLAYTQLQTIRGPNGETIVETIGKNVGEIETLE